MTTIGRPSTRAKHLARINELRSLGITRARALASHMTISEDYISQILREEGLRQPLLSQAIALVAEELNFDYRLIAEAVGTTPGAVYPTMRRMGLTPVGPRAEWKRKGAAARKNPGEVRQHVGSPGTNEQTPTGTDRPSGAVT